VEARQTLGNPTVDQRAADFDRLADSTSRRLILQALAEDLHEYWATDDERGEYYKRITRSTAKFLVSFIAVLVVLIIADVFVRTSVPIGNPNRAFGLTAGVLLTVVASGLFGAGLSMLTGLNARLEAASMPALEKMDSAINRLARSTVGAAAAIVVFGLAASGLVEGSVMPKLVDNGGLALDTMSPPTLSHLVVACILAGFSEKFVPSKLGELEK
jgi:hypothetical protein